MLRSLLGVKENQEPRVERLLLFFFRFLRAKTSPTTAGYCWEPQSAGKGGCHCFIQSWVWHLECRRWFLRS